MIHIRQVSPQDESVLKGLCELLTDVVGGGASVGFLAPLSRQTAERYWKQVFAALGKHHFLWVAEAVYRHLGWQRAGEIPDFALTPDGRLHTTVYYYKINRTGP